MIDGTFEVAQARLPARHGARAGPEAWIALRAAMTPAALLEATRAGSLRKWISAVRAESTLDETELALRERLREYIAEVAKWMPGEWRDAVLWTRRLLDLPALQRLADPGERPAWMQRDPSLENIVQAPAHATRLRDDWIRRWRRLWPAADREGCAAVEEVLAAFASHLHAFTRAESADAWALREALQQRLEILFRRHSLTAGAAFSHLALVALDLERLRAEVVHRMARRDLEAA